PDDGSSSEPLTEKTGTYLPGRIPGALSLSHCLGTGCPKLARYAGSTTPLAFAVVGCREPRHLPRRPITASAVVRAECEEIRNSSHRCQFAWLYPWRVGRRVPQRAV